MRDYAVPVKVLRSLMAKHRRNNDVDDVIRIIVPGKNCISHLGGFLTDDATGMVFPVTRKYFETASNSICWFVVLANIGRVKCSLFARSFWTGADISGLGALKRAHRKYVILVQLFFGLSTEKEFLSSSCTFEILRSKILTRDVERSLIRSGIFILYREFSLKEWSDNRIIRIRMTSHTCEFSLVKKISKNSTFVSKILILGDQGGLKCEKCKFTWSVVKRVEVFIKILWHNKIHTNWTSKPNDHEKIPKLWKNFPSRPPFRSFDYDV